MPFSFLETLISGGIKMNTKLSINQKLIRMFANVLSIAVILALAFPAVGSVSAQEESPYLRAFPDGDFVDGSYWPAYQQVFLEINGDLFDPQTADGDGYVEFNLAGYDLERGNTLTMSSGDTLVEYTARQLYVAGINLDTQTITGTVDGQQTVHLWVGAADEYVDTDESGNWTVVLSGYEDDVLTPGTCGNAEAWGEENSASSTIIDWCVPEPPPNPHFTVFPEWEWFDGLDWPDGAIVSIGVAGKPECETTKESWDGFFNGNFGESCDLEIGDTVTFTDGETIRTHTVQNLTVTKANHEDDTIKGIADSGAEVYVWPHATGEQQLVVAKTKGAAEGKWNVDFSGIFDLVLGECGRSEIRDEDANSTAVDWCIPNPRIVASESGDWFWTTDFKPVDLDISIYDSPDEGASLLWSGQQVADEGGFIFVGSEIHGQDLLPGNTLVVSDGDSQKSLVLQPISVTMFDTQYDFMAGFAPAGSEVWAAAGPQDWQERIMVEADQITGKWFANFAEIGFDITEDMQPWSYVHIYDDDGDANEGNVPPLEFWVAAFTYDLPAGSFTDNGVYPYQFEVEWSFPEPGTFSGQEGDLVVSGDAPLYDGYVLLRGPNELRGVNYPEGLSCEEVGEVNPNQPMRFLIGWLPADYGMTYQEAQTILENLTGRVVWGDGMSAELTRHEIIPFSFDDLDTWFQYVCTFTADIILDANTGWVDSGIDLAGGTEVTMTAYGEAVTADLNEYPGSISGPDGQDWNLWCGQYEGAPPPCAMNDAPYGALVGKIGEDGEPFFIGSNFPFTPTAGGDLYLAVNDNLGYYDDNSGSYMIFIQ
jgi:hypothetical protein